MDTNQILYASNLAATTMQKSKGKEQISKIVSKRPKKIKIKIEGWEGGAFQDIREYIK